MGHRLTICAYPHGYDIAGLDVRRSPSIPWRRRAEVGVTRHKMALDALLGLKSLAVTWQVKPDLIHAHLHEGAFIGGILSRIFRVPLVFDLQGSMTGEMIDHNFLRRDGLFYAPWRRFERLIDRMPGAILTSSANAKQLLTHDFGCAPDRITHVPDCVNPDVFKPRWDNEYRAQSEQLKTRLGIPAHYKVIVYIGILAEYQGTGLLLQAAAQLRQKRSDVFFLIMGFPNVEGYWLQAKALGLERHASFPGKIPYTEAPQYLALGDVAVSPKISATEGSGKVLNYMAMCLPVVAFDTPVSREYLGDLGVYAPVGDTSAFAEAIASLLDDEPRAMALGRALRQRAIDCYSWQRAGEQIVSIYDRLIAGRHRGRG
jgi:glycosyltransferase involved in cell wall biosynthesis